MKLQPWEQHLPHRWIRKYETGRVVARVSLDLEGVGVPQWKWSAGALRGSLPTEKEAKTRADQELYRFFRIPQPEYDEQWALQLAVDASKRSNCQKGKRGVVIWHPGFPSYTSGWDHPPDSLACEGDVHCDKHCIHAEAHAILAVPDLMGREPGTTDFLAGAHMLFAQTVEGALVPSGGPSCWPCTGLILQAQISTLWLLQENGLCSYPTDKCFA